MLKWLKPFLKNILEQSSSHDHVNGWMREGFWLHRNGRFREAAVYYQRILQVRPQHDEALYLLGEVAYQEGRIDDSIDLIGQALDVVNDNPTYQFRYAALLEETGRFSDAIVGYRRLLDIDPSHAQAANNLGGLLFQSGDVKGAERLYCQALEHDSELLPARYNLGRVHHRMRHFSQAAVNYQQALEGRPDFADGHRNLGHVLIELRRFGEAFEAYQRVPAEDTPDYACVLNNMAYVYQERCQLELAEQCFRRAAAIDPNNTVTRDGLLFCMNYDPIRSIEDIYSEYLQWNKSVPRPAVVKPLDNVADPEKRLRVGYVSADFFSHSASFFIEPLLSAHDRQQVEVVCYAGTNAEDEVSERLRENVQLWRNTVGMSDEAMADLIRADGIDILVDLSGHSKGNRLTVFARGPAPVQVTWLGYGYTTGLSEMNYFVADAVMVPECDDRWFSESVWRLPRPMFCYRPPLGMPPVSDLPAERNGYVTFGCFSRAIRYNERVVDAWSAILRAMPNSRLMLDTQAFDDEDTRRLFWRRFAEQGVSQGRIDLNYSSPSRAVWDAYNSVDIALDPFPHNAGTTTFEALWMGVPVLSLMERPPLGRFGAAILVPLGLEDWLAGSEEHYVALAQAKALDLASLAGFRRTLRQRLEKSAFRDEIGFARAMEGAFREMWRRWCAKVI